MARFRAILAASLAAATAVSLLTGATMKKDAEPALVIGVVLARSGFAAGFDVPGVIAAEIARDEYNKTGGFRNRKIRFIYCDNKSDPAKSADCAARLLSRNLDFMISGCDYDIDGPAARLAEKKRVVNFSLCAGSPKWNAIGPHSYSMSPGTPTEGAVLAQWALNGPLKCRNAYLLTDTLIDYSKAVATYIKRHYKGTIVGEDTFKNPDPSFATQISRIQATSPRPSCIFMSTFVPGGATLLRQLRAAGVSQPVISPDGMDGDFWISAIPNLSDFYYDAYASIFGDDPNPRYNALIKEIEKRYGKALSGSSAVCGYSIMQALKIAITRAGSTDGEKVNAQLLKFRNVPLLLGRTTFSKTNRLALGVPMRIIQVKNGKFSFRSMFKATGVRP